MTNQHIEDPKANPSNVMTWNEMYRQLDFLNGKPIELYSPTQLMMIEIRELRAALYGHNSKS